MNSILRKHPVLCTILAITLLVLPACAKPHEARFLAGFDPAAISTIALLPVTYGADCDQPPNFDLGRAIRQHARKELQRKGYKVLFEGKHYGGIAPFPSKVFQLPDEARNVAADAFLLIHVNSHLGIEQGESRERDPMLPTATIYADALLTQRQPFRQLWSDSSSGSNRMEFFNQKFIADDAASQLVRHLLATLPAAGEEVQVTSQEKTLSK